MLGVFLSVIFEWAVGHLRKSPCIEIGGSWSGPYPQWIKDRKLELKGDGSFIDLVCAHKETHNTITYLAEPNGDKWQTPEESRELGTGDCEDFASLTIDNAIRRGINPSKLYWLYIKQIGIDNGHILACYMDNSNDPLVMDNNRPYPVRLHHILNTWSGWKPVSIFNKWEAKELSVKGE